MKRRWKLEFEGERREGRGEGGIWSGRKKRTMNKGERSALGLGWAALDKEVEKLFLILGS